MNKKLLAVLAILAAIAVGIWLWLRSKKGATNDLGDARSAGPEDNPVPGDDTSGEDPGTYTPTEDGESPTDDEEYEDPGEVTDEVDTIDVNDPASDTSSGSGVKPASKGGTAGPPAYPGGPRFKAVKYAGGKQKSDQANVPKNAPDGTKWIPAGGFGAAPTGGVKGSYSRTFISDSGRYKMGVVYSSGGYALSVKIQDATKKVFAAAGKAK